MSLDLNLIARLRAWEYGRAQLFASHCKIAIQPHAMMICPIAMAGEDTATHIMAVGSIGQPSEIYFVPDPRRRDDQNALFVNFGARLELYFQDCRNRRTYPQIIVSSGAAASHLDILSERLRFNKLDARIRRVGELLAYATERYPIDGQQAMHTATSALRQHWATGQDTGEDEHLLATLTWIDPPADRDVLEAVAEAEHTPMGINTDPMFDRETLAPLVDAYNEAFVAKASDATLDTLARQIQDELEPIVSSIYEATQRAIALLLNMELPWLPSLIDLERREAEEFENFMLGRDMGHFIPLSDSPKRAAFGYAAREDAAENLEALLLLEDRVARAQGKLEGRVLVGQVENPQVEHIGPRNFIYRFQLKSNQSVLRVRRRDELSWADDPRLRVIVEDVRREEAITTISLKIIKGQRAVGIPQEGMTLEVLPRVPDWNWIHRVRGHLRKRLAQTPWTHRSDSIPNRPARNSPVDPLAIVEALR